MNSTNNTTQFDMGSSQSKQADKGACNTLVETGEALRS